ncbi:MAG TPA: ABC transporter ATP-binding protein/permease [Jatrophihabitans sp.]|jgi:ABC-type multidrug transport system fused ATPase/permease subunit|uniref:ABC transporter ATP-binding protein n=1 Tax=Jatrophihabitans sp. TaxID=1932789 RepID=UPI002F016B93
MTDEPDATLADVAPPYWALDTGATAPGLPTMLRQLPRSTRSILAMVYRAAPGTAVSILVLQLLSGVASAFGLLTTTAVLDQLLTAGPTSERVAAATPALMAVAALYSARGLLDAAVALAKARVGPAVRRLSATKLIEVSVGVELAAFDDDAFYDRLHRARDRGLVHLDRSVDSLLELLAAALAMLAAASTLLILHPLLVAVLVLSIAPEAWSVLRAARLGYEGRLRMTTLGRRMWMLGELLTDRAAATELRSYQAEPFVLAEYGQVTRSLCAEEARVEAAQARCRAVGRALAGAGAAATFAVLAVLLRAGWIPLAVAGGSAIAIRVATGALGRVVVAVNQLFEQGLYVGDYQDFLATAGQRTPGRDGLAVTADPRQIDLDRVSFSYPGSPPGAEAIRDVSLCIDAGRTIALVGENGSGKSTLAKLIAALYVPTSGEIRWDGRPLTELDRSGVADQIVMVSQNPLRWPHTARVNVRLGRHDRHDPGDAELRRAAEQARADEVVQALPNGWHTLLSKEFRDGHELSGGQWQRLAIARGLFRDAPVLICDEPTAPLDARAERAVYDALRRLADGRTIVLISHRLASVQQADLICVLHQGSIVERGTHAELLARGGRYAQLLTLQEELFRSGLAGSNAGAAS